MPRKNELSFSKLRFAFLCLFVSDSVAAPADKQTCDTINTFLTAESEIDRGVIWANSVCLIHDVVTTSTLYADILALAQTNSDPSSGSGASEVALATAVIDNSAQFDDFSEVFGFDGTLYTELCVTGASSEVININSDGQLLNQSYTNNDCAQFASKRSVSPIASSSFTPGSLNVFARRQDSAFNPCTEFLSEFPPDVTSLAGIAIGCGPVTDFAFDVTVDDDFFNAVQDLQRYCNGFLHSGNQEPINFFVELLVAIQAFVPYCTANTIPVSSSSSSSITSTIHSKTVSTHHSTSSSSRGSTKHSTKSHGKSTSSSKHSHTVVSTLSSKYSHTLVSATARSTMSSRTASAKSTSKPSYRGFSTGISASTSQGASNGTFSAIYCNTTAILSATYVIVGESELGSLSTAVSVSTSTNSYFNSYNSASASCVGGSGCEVLSTITSSGPELPTYGTINVTPTPFFASSTATGEKPAEYTGAAPNHTPTMALAGVMVAVAILEICM